MDDPRWGPKKIVQGSSRFILPCGYITPGQAALDSKFELEWKFIQLILFFRIVSDRRLVKDERDAPRINLGAAVC